MQAIITTTEAGTSRRKGRFSGGMPLTQGGMRNAFHWNAQITLPYECVGGVMGAARESAGTS